MTHHVDEHNDQQNVHDTEQDGPIAVPDEMSDHGGEATPGHAHPAAETTPPTESEPVDLLTAELDNVRQQLLRAHADFDNFRRRTRQEKEDLQKFATKRLMLDLLPVVDNFQRALTAATAIEGQGELLNGVEMVQRQLLGVLEQHGVRPMAVEGQPFDPSVHEAVLQEPAGDAEVGVITAELQTGYWLADKVLRPAMVKVTV